MICQEGFGFSYHFPVWPIVYLWVTSMLWVKRLLNKPILDNWHLFLKHEPTVFFQFKYIKTNNDVQKWSNTHRAYSFIKHILFFKYLINNNLMIQKYWCMSKISWLEINVMKPFKVANLLTYISYAVDVLYFPLPYSKVSISG